MPSSDKNETYINPRIQKFWIEEAKKRINEIRSSAVKPIPGEEALTRVRQLLES